MYNQQIPKTSKNILMEGYLACAKLAYHIFFSFFIKKC